MALPENEEAKENRKRILKAEAEAVLLLLMLRRKRLSPEPSLSQIERFEGALADSILKIRIDARREAQEFSRLVHGGGLQKSGIGELLDDAKRAKRYAANASGLIVETTEHGKPLIKTIDNRLKTIAISESSGAYNEEHRLAVAERAEQLGLVEVWDASLDMRVCDVCADMDGTEAIDGEFPQGLVPGNVHAKCRCTSHFIERHLIH